MDGIPCGCECEKLFAETPGIPARFTSGSHSATGDCFDVAVSADWNVPFIYVNGIPAYPDAPLNGIGAVTCSIAGIGDETSTAVVRRDPTEKAIAFSTKTSTDTLTLQDESMRLIRQQTGIQLRLDACAVGTDGEILLTASSECSTGGNVTATPLVFTGLSLPGNNASYSFDSLYLQSPPDGTYGHNACSFTIYRDGEIIASFVSPSHDDEKLSNPEMVGGDAEISSGVGSKDDPISVTGKNGGDFWRVRVTPGTFGQIVVEWDTDPPTTSRHGAARGAPVEIANSGKQSIKKMYLVPDRMDHPFPQDVIANCSGEGSYLVVAKHETGPPSTVRIPTPLISYASFVILKTKYAYAMRLADDRWADQSASVPSDCYFENPFRQRIQCGTGGPTKYENVARNDPLHAGVDTAIARAVPQSRERGARPRFIVTSDGGDPALVFDKPLAKFPLRFNRPVTGVTASMVSVSGYTPPDGDSATLAVLSLKRVGDSLTDYVVTIDTEGQVPNSMWTITFTPTGGIGTFPASLPLSRTTLSLAEIGENMAAVEAQFGYQEVWHDLLYVDAATGIRYVWLGPMFRQAAPPVRTSVHASLAAFPATGEQGVVYIDASTGDDYVWSVTGYRRPTAEDCEEWGTTKLACRFMWCLGRDKSIGRYCINTKPDADTTMPSRASLSTTVTVEERPAGPMETTITASGANVTSSAVTKRSYLSDEGATAFLPRMPPGLSGETNGRFSYFGIPTTIYPAAPKWIGECQSPSEPQRHASFLFTAGDVLELTATDGNGRQFDLKSDGQPQNFWSYDEEELPGDRLYFEPVGLTGTTVTYERHKTVTTSGKLSLAAERGRLTYRGLFTTSVTELVLKIFGYRKQIVYRSANTYTGYRGSMVGSDIYAWTPPEGFGFDWGEWDEGSEFIEEMFRFPNTVTIIVPPDKEAELASGEEVTIDGWKFKAKIED